MTDASYCTQVLVEMGLMNFLPDHSLTRSWNYKCEPPAPTLKTKVLDAYQNVILFEN
jgi:hypothetical protein